jgi:threonine/homoserine/homoserine lactone efflux protein
VLESLIKGIAIGLFFAVPVGPIGILCIRRSLTTGFKSGLATGLGAATADALFGAIAAFGLTGISSFLLEHKAAFNLFGGIFLCYIGVGTFRSKPAPANSEIEPHDAIGNSAIRGPANLSGIGRDRSENGARSSVAYPQRIRAVATNRFSTRAPQRGNCSIKDYLSTTILTLTNPMSIVLFVAAFSSFGIGSTAGYWSALALVIGVFAGSTVWWIILSGLISYLRTRFNQRWIQITNQLSGIIIFGSGALTLITLFR